MQVQLKGPTLGSLRSHHRVLGPTFPVCLIKQPFHKDIYRNVLVMTSYFFFSTRFRHIVTDRGFRKIHRKTPAKESLLIKLQAEACNFIKKEAGWGLQLYLKRDLGTGVFL